VPSGFSNTEILIVHVHVYEYAYVDEGAVCIEAAAKAVRLKANGLRPGAWKSIAENADQYENDERVSGVVVMTRATPLSVVAH
jgi:hypothetical protein